MKQLRQYIRQILLTEGMKTADELPDDAYVWINHNGSMFSVQVAHAGAGYRGPGVLANVALRKAPHGCSGAWEVTNARAKEGWGPLAYDIAMEYVGHEGIMCDRASVSDDAAKVWDFYLNSRSDVKAVQLDSLQKPFITPDDQSDDCAGNTFLTHQYQELEDAAPDMHRFDPSEFPEHGELWEDHWSTKKYVKVGGTPVIDQLNDMNLLEYK
jgi:hypothetical protein